MLSFVRPKTILLISLLIFGVNAKPSTISAYDSSAKRSVGRVRGAVMDINGAVWPGVTVVFEKEQTKWQVISDEVGGYEIELPEGIYRVTIESPNFYPFRRAAFYVRAGEVVVINLVVVPLPIVSELSVATSPKLSSEAKRHPFQYESFLVPDSPDEQLELLVRFSEKRRQGSIVEYGKAMISYNTLTIYADRAWLNLKTFCLEARGDVIVEDGKQRQRARSTVIGFKAGEVVLHSIR